MNLPIATALKESLRVYSKRRAMQDITAGVTVGLIAIPLAMALAIASGVAPQHGLYTAIIAGTITALTGGSRVNVTGPTAAFVVILLPIIVQFGLSGLLLATMMAGGILLIMGLCGMGRLIQYIPFPVTTGFTAGIGVVIVSLQIKDLLGLHFHTDEASFWATLQAVFAHAGEMRLPEIAIAVITFAVLIIWPKLKWRLPAHLVALALSTLVAMLMARLFTDFHVSTIGSQFSYIQDGISHGGIPPLLPHFDWPWHDVSAGAKSLTLDFTTLRALIGPALAIALLGAIESLLCAVVADGLSGYKHDANAELVGQGLGNIIAPLFGGITATAAIARTAANVRNGATSPIAAVTHGVVVLAALLVLGPTLAHIPMAALAALLCVIAWNMSDARQFIKIIRTAPGADVLVMLLCFALTVIFNMVIAVEVGVVLASLLFIKRMTELSESILTTGEYCHLHGALPEHVAIYDIRGPLFFGAAEQAMHALWQCDTKMHTVIINMEDVPMIDLSGIVALRALLGEMTGKKITVYLCGLNSRLTSKLEKAAVIGSHPQLITHMQVSEAIALVRQQTAI